MNYKTKYDEAENPKIIDALERAEDLGHCPKSIRGFTSEMEDIEVVRKLLMRPTILFLGEKRLSGY